MLGNEQLTIIGHIGQDASIKEHNGNRFISFSIGVNKGYKNANGDWVDVTNWWSVIVRNEKLVPHLTKGKYIMVQGEPKIKVFRNQEGVTLPALNLNADSIHFLVQPKTQDTQRTAYNSPSPQQSGVHPSSQMPPKDYVDMTGSQEEDDLPF